MPFRNLCVRIPARKSVLSPSASTRGQKRGPPAARYGHVTSPTPGCSSSEITVARQSGSSRISLSVITTCSCRASGISARRLHTFAFGRGDTPATISRAGTAG